MAIYHLTSKAFGRSGGHSSTAAAAYRAGEKIVDTRTGVVHDYTKRAGVAATQLTLPGGATADRAEFWNRVEQHHKRGDAVVAREIEVALPSELTAEQRQALAFEYAQGIADRYGVAADVAIHEPSKKGDERNHHAHILLSACLVNPDGTLGKKCVALDPIAADRANIPRPIIAERERWAEAVNRALAAAGQAARVDHRSLAAQSEAATARGDLAQAVLLTREPTQHEGKTATAAKRQGHVLDRAKFNDGVRKDNVAALARFLREAEAEGRLHQPPPGQHAQARQDAAHKPRQSPTGPLTPVGVEGYTRTVHGKTISVGGYVRKQRSAAKPAAAGGGAAVPRGVSHAPSHGRTGGAAPVKSPSIGKSKDQRHEEQRQAEAAQLLAKSARWHEQALADYLASLEAMGRHLADWQRDHLRGLIDPARPPDKTSIKFNEWLAQRHQVATEIARIPEEKQQRLERLEQAQAKVDRRQQRVDRADQDDPQPNRLRWKSREAWAQRREERAHRLKRAKHQHRHAEQAASPDAFADLDRQINAMMAYLAALDRDYVPPLPAEQPTPPAEPTSAPQTTVKPHASPVAPRARLGDHFQRKDTPSPLRPRPRPPGPR